MQITRIEKTGRKSRLYLNDTPAFCLYPSEVRKLGLSEGDELSDAEREQIEEEILGKRAKKRVLMLLQKADQTSAYLRQKLIGDGYPETVAEAAIAYAASYGYVDDLRYARSYIEQTGGARSRRRIVSDLIKKGISAALIDEAFEGMPQPDEAAQIRQLMDKRHYNPETASAKEREKMIRFLMGRGYDFEQIRQCVGEMKAHEG